LKVSADFMISKPTPPWLFNEYEPCRNSITRFNKIILNRPPFWTKQAELAESFRQKETTLCMAGNSVGKSFSVAALVLWYMMYHKNSKVIVTAPSETQLKEVCWSYILKAFHECPYKLFPKARVYKQPMKIEIAEDWWVLAYSTKKKERLSGHHAGNLSFIVDEASGVDREIYEALDSLAPHRTLLIGNPLRPEGVFYERCMRQMSQPDKKVNLIKIPSTMSPDITVEHSARGMASKGWLEKMKREWGEGSLWWKPHIQAEFPEADSASLIPLDWFNACEHSQHIPGGPKRISIDLGTGGGGDRSVIYVRDDNGIITYWESNTASLEQTAWKAFEMKRQHDVSDHRVTFDQAGIGADFAFRLRSVGIFNPTPYIGGRAANKQFRNLRAWSYWQLRSRLDPNGSWFRPFSIPQQLLSPLKRELMAIRYVLNAMDSLGITDKDDVVNMLGHSPDLADCLGQSFAYLD
jgi:phage terminase large subunit